MAEYPSLKRGLIAVLTLFLVGVPIAYWLSRGGDLSKLINPAPANAQGAKDTGDWHMYGGSPARNMANTRVKGLPVEWDIKKKVNILWVADLGSKSYGGPTVAGGHVLIGTNNQGLRDPKLVKQKVDPLGKPVLKDGKPVMEPIDLGIVMSFAEADGKFEWQSTFTKLPGGQVVDWPYEGICSSPHIDGDRCYFVSNRCEVVCAELKTGNTLWTVDMIGQLGVFPHNISDCSPLLVDGHLWVVTSNGVNEDHINVPAPKAPSFIKIKIEKGADGKDKGTVVWQDNTPTSSLLVAQKGKDAQKDFFKRLVNRGLLIQHGQWSNPSYGVVKGQPQVIFPGGDGWIYAFDPKGELIWKFDCNPKDSKYELQGKGDRNDFIGTPVIYNDRVYIGVGQDPEHNTGVGHLYCIDMTKKGDVSPELVVDDSVFPPKTKKNPNSAEVWHYGGVINDPVLQEKLGRNYSFGRTMSTCAIHEDIVYISELSGHLHALDAKTGKLHWVHDTESAIWSSPYYADGKVYLGTDGGTVTVFEHGKTLKVLAENKMGGKVRATPIAANGVLYVMTENRLYAIKK